MTIPVIRKRAKRPKTHTGCITCRARHIKCDEDKPACKRCVKSGRTCEGYTEPKRPQRHRPVHVLPKPDVDSAKAVVVAAATTTATTEMVRLALTPMPSIFTCDLNTTERMAFEFFRRETAHRLPGNAWTLSWPRLALHVGPHEPAVMHIAIALGALHRTRRGRAGERPERRPKGQRVAWSDIGRGTWNDQISDYGDDDDGDGDDVLTQLQSRDFALRQYGKALAHLRTYIAELEADAADDAQVGVVLLVVLLLFCFEVWSGDDVRAGVHLRTGLQILYEWHRSRGRLAQCHGRSSVLLDVRPRDQMGLLVQSFVRLDADLSIVIKGEPCLHPVVREPIPEAFGSLEHAMVHLDALSTAVQDVYKAMADLAMAELTRDPSIDPDSAVAHCLAGANARTVDLGASPGLAERIDGIRRNVRQCMSALVFVPFKVEQEAAHLLVQIQLFCLWYDTMAWREADEMHADQYERQFDHALTLVERYIRLEQESGRADSPSPSSPRSGSSRSSSTVPDTRPVISLGTSLVAGICMIAFKCRTSSVRRRCIQSLRDVNLQGVFDSQYLVAFVQTMVDVEENRARASLGRSDREGLQCHEIPLEARIVDIDLGGRLEKKLENTFYKDDFGYLIYATRNCDGTLQTETTCFAVERW